MAAASGMAQLMGGVIRLSQWAVGSLREAIENSGNSQEINVKEGLAISLAR